MWPSGRRTPARLPTTSRRSSAVFPQQLIHLSGLRLEVFVEGNLKIKKLVAVGVTQLVQVQLGALQRMVKPGDIIEQEPRTRGVRLNLRSAVLEGVEVLFDIAVAGRGLELDVGQRAGQRNLDALTLLARH